MTDADRFAAATGAGVLPGAELCAELLDSVVTLGRAVFAAAACSISRFDERTDELVFAAVAGEGSDRIVGTRFAAGIGIAGWVLASEQAIEINEVVSDPRFATDVAERTGYIPHAIMAAPLVAGERPLGVLTVLDRTPGAPGALDAMELLGLLARQATSAVDVVQRIERAQAVGSGGDAVAALTGLATVLDRLGERNGEAATALLEALTRVLGGTARG